MINVQVLNLTLSIFFSEKDVTIPENIDEQIKGFVGKSYRNEYDQLELHIFKFRF